MNKKNWDWDWEVSFVSIPEKVFRTGRRVPFSNDEVAGHGGFVERAMWAHTRYMLDVFILVKQNQVDPAAWAYGKSIRALKSIFTHMSQAGFPDMKKMLLKHMIDESLMGQALVNGDKMLGKKYSDDLTRLSWIREAFWNVDWDKTHGGHAGIPKIIMVKHVESMYTYANMLASIDSYSKCTALFKRPELVCLAFGMELGALLDQVVKVGLLKKEPAVPNHQSNIGTEARRHSSVGSRITTGQKKKEEDGMSGLSSKFEGQQTKYWN